EIAFPEPQLLTGLTLTSESRDLQLSIEVYAAGIAQAGRYESTFSQLRPDQPIEMEFDPSPGLVRRVRITLTAPQQTATGSVTLHDLALNLAR
ncbi:MAG TPA: hypothetical protein VLG46_08005, partial [Anaerolineae bacterium]|nr:hypothetical protein [Anaerolineae bacterium]